MVSFHRWLFFSLKGRAGRLETIPVRAEPRPPQPGAFPFQTVDGATGKLFGMIVTDRNEQSKVRRAAGDAFVSSCWEEVCVVESTSNLAMPARLDDFLKRFEFVDPENFSALVRRNTEHN